MLIAAIVLAVIDQHDHAVRNDAPDVLQQIRLDQQHPGA